MTASISRPVTSSSTVAPVPTPVVAPIQREEAKVATSTVANRIVREIRPYCISSNHIECAFAKEPNKLRNVWPIKLLDPKATSDDLLQDVYQTYRIACLEVRADKKTLFVHPDWEAKMRSAGVTQLVQEYPGGVVGSLGEVNVSTLSGPGYTKMVKTFFNTT